MGVCISDIIIAWKHQYWFQLQCVWVDPRRRNIVNVVDTIGDTSPVKSESVSFYCTFNTLWCSTYLYCAYKNFTPNQHKPWQVCDTLPGRGSSRAKLQEQLNVGAWESKESELECNLSKHDHRIVDCPIKIKQYLMKKGLISSPPFYTDRGSGGSGKHCHRKRSKARFMNRVEEISPRSTVETDSQQSNRKGARWHSQEQFSSKIDDEYITSRVCHHCWITWHVIETRKNFLL